MGSLHNSDHRIEIENSVVQTSSNAPIIIITFITLALIAHLLLGTLGSFISSCLKSAWKSVVGAMPPTLAHVLQAGPEKFARGTVSTITTPMQRIEGIGNTFGRGSGNAVISRGKRTHPDAPKGLGNWDNSCYQNSVLQALAGLPTFNNFLADFDKRNEGTESSSTIFSIRNLLRELNNTSTDCSYLWTPRKLKSMNSWQQQDAQEYLSKLMEAVEKDLKVDIQSELEENMADLAFLTTESACSEEGVRNSGKFQRIGDSENSSDGSYEDCLTTNQCSNPLEGLLAQRVGCTECGYTDGLSLVPFTCLTLPLANSFRCRLKDCMDEFTKLEYIDGVDCPKCSLLQSQAQLKDGVEGITQAKVDREKDRKDENERLCSDGVASVLERLDAVEQALQDQDYSERTLTDKCRISGRMRKTSTKSRQAVLLRSPKCLVIHVNRSIFDEYTGAQLKNYAALEFPEMFGITPWVLGGGAENQFRNSGEELSQWSMDPRQSILPGVDPATTTGQLQYVLKAVITHSGRHENGHYVCYRRVPNSDDSKPIRCNAEYGSLGGKWWRISDQYVDSVEEGFVLSQPGAFMLFYERDDTLLSQRSETVAESEQTAATAQLSECNEHVQGTEPVQVTKSKLESSQLDGSDENEGRYEIDRGSTESRSKPVSPTSMRTATSSQQEINLRKPFSCPHMVVSV